MTYIKFNTITLHFEYYKFMTCEVPYKRIGLPKVRDLLIQIENDNKKDN